MSCVTLRQHQKHVQKLLFVVGPCHSVWPPRSLALGSGDTPPMCLGRRRSTYHQKHKILTFLAPQHWEQACNQVSSIEHTYSTLPWNLVTQKGGVSEDHFPVKVDTGSRGNLVVLVESFNTNISDVGIAWCSICAQCESRRVSTGPVLLHGHHSWL